MVRSAATGRSTRIACGELLRLRLGKITAFCGQDGDSKPFGGTVAIYYRTTQGWVDSEDDDVDYGLLSQIRYVKTDFANGVDFAITVEGTGEGLWTQSDVNAAR